MTRTSAEALTASGVLTTTLDYQSDQQARRFALVLTTPPTAGTELRLVITADALRDPFGNAATAGADQIFTWTSTETVLADTEPPAVHDRVRQGYLEVEFDEEVDLATVPTGVTVTPSGATALALNWSSLGDGFTVRTDETLPAGTFDLDIATTVQDLAGSTLASALGQPFEVVNASEDLDLFEAPDERVIPTSSVGNAHGFHGLPMDPETGLIYVRNRYYDPELGRFITADPLGYVDGPSLYTFAGNNSVNLSDPMGLCKGEAGDPEECVEWWPYFPPGVATQAHSNLEARARNPEEWRLTLAIYGAQATVVGVVASVEEDARHFLNLPHHLYDMYQRRRVAQQRTEELQAEMGCSFCVGENLRIIRETLVAEGLLDAEVMGPGFAEIPVGPRRFKPRAPRGATGAGSANAQAALARKLRVLEGAQQSATRVRTLPDGRVRYYGPERAAATPGPTRGAALVTEYNPTTGQVRQWYESYDAAGTVVRVHPKLIDGQVLDAPHFPPTGAEVPR